jgi:asparagine synthase (glutamine-hydrolysing)
LRSFYSKDLDKVDDPIFSHLVRWENTSRIKTFFSRRLIGEIGEYDGPEQVRQSLPADYEKWDYLSKAQYLEMSIFLSNYLLSSQGDKVAMAHSLEIRLPFLDYRVIDFMGKVPAKWKILGLDEKHILKKSFTGILPEDIVKRPKKPYRAPIQKSLINDKTSEYTQEALSEKSLNSAGLFDANRVKKLLEKVQAAGHLGEIDSMALVGILSSQLIFHQFIEKFPDKSEYSVSPDLIVDRRSAALKTVQ